MLSRAVHFSELERLSSYVKAREWTAKFNDGAPAGRARVGLGHQVPAGFPKILKSRRWLVNTGIAPLKDLC